LKLDNAIKKVKAARLGAYVANTGENEVYDTVIDDEPDNDIIATYQ